MLNSICLCSRTVVHGWSMRPTLTMSLLAMWTEPNIGSHYHTDQSPTGIGTNDIEMKLFGDEPKIEASFTRTLLRIMGRGLLGRPLDSPGEPFSAPVLRAWSNAMCSSWKPPRKMPFVKISWRYKFNKVGSEESLSVIRSCADVVDPSCQVEVKSTRRRQGDHDWQIYQWNSTQFHVYIQTERREKCKAANLIGRIDPLYVIAIPRISVSMNVILSVWHRSWKKFGDDPGNEAIKKRNVLWALYPSISPQGKYLAPSFHNNHQVWPGRWWYRPSGAADISTFSIIRWLLLQSSIVSVCPEWKSGTWSVWQHNAEDGFLPVSDQYRSLPTAAVKRFFGSSNAYLDGSE